MSFAKLAVQPPLDPMEAKSVDAIPTDNNWRYEPKWDGFRCLAFREGSTIELQSKAGESLTRYFPELVAGLASLKPGNFVLDGEIILLVEEKLSFDDLLQRIHPAESRVKKLSQTHPVRLVVFDLLADHNGADLRDLPFAKRRQKLEAFYNAYLSDSLSFILSPQTDTIEQAKGWLSTMRGQLDGVVAKDKNLPYLSGERAMQKIKTLRTADCVVGGFRYLAKEKLVGSLLLGLYDNQGLLHHVGFTSSIDASQRTELTKTLEKLIEPPGFTGRAPGGPSRWSTAKSSEWQPLRPELVVEVRYDHFTGNRFRHGTKLMRWRPDKAPRQCSIKQVQTDTLSPLTLLAG